MTFFFLYEMTFPFSHRITYYHVKLTQTDVYVNKRVNKREKYYVTKAISDIAVSLKYTFSILEFLLYLACYSLEHYECEKIHIYFLYRKNIFFFLCILIVCKRERIIYI